MRKPLKLTGEQTLNLEVPFEIGSMLFLDYVIDIRNVQNGRIGLRFSNNLNESVSFHFNIGERNYELDRTHSGDVKFHPKFTNKLPPINRISKNNQLKDKSFDTGSIEIFADDGLNTASALFFPSEMFENIQIFGSIPNDGKSIVVHQLRILALNSIWA